MRGDVISNHSDSTKSLLIWSVSGGSRVLNQNMTKKCTGEGGDQRLRSFVPKKHYFGCFPGPILNTLFLKEFNANCTQTT